MSDISRLGQQEILARAVTLEKDERFYRDLAAAMGETCAGAAALFVAMAREEDAHRHRLLDLYRNRFGDEIAGPPGRIRSTATAPTDYCRASGGVGTSGVPSGKARSPSAMGRAFSIFFRRGSR